MVEDRELLIIKIVIIPYKLKIQINKNLNKIE